ncbi:hypothetical protein HDV00_010141 [Rhizophlyctis rosea]|nr:hypothetical protein HDV00_010141 [Rhizophlyctis rosea]
MSTSKRIESDAPAPCYITALPEHVLFDIFEYIQPRTGLVEEVEPDVVKVPRGKFGWLPYEQHLAQVCKTFRAMAFQLREGNCFDLGLYASGHDDPACTNCNQDHNLRAGLELFMADPMRIQFVRTLNIQLDEFPSIWTNSSLFKLLNLVDHTRLLGVAITGSDPDRRSWDAEEKLRTERIFADLVVDFLAKAEGPLRLQSFKVKGYHFELTCALRSCLYQLQHSGLRGLVLEVFNEYRVEVGDRDDRHPALQSSQGLPKFIIPATVLFKSLGSLQMTAHSLFENLAASEPNLKKIHIITRKVLPSPSFTLGTLTQPTLTTFEYDGSGWERCLSTIPITTLNQVTSLDIECICFDLYRQTPECTWKDHFFRSLSHLCNLVSLTMTNGHCFSCEDIALILSRVGRLETFRLSVLGDWDYDQVRAGLAMQTGLKEVYLTTEGDKDVAGIETETYREWLQAEYGEELPAGHGTMPMFELEAWRVSEQFHIPEVYFYVRKRERVRKML